MSDSYENVQQRHDGIRTFLHNEDALRRRHGPDELYVRPQLYGDESSTVIVGGWAFLEGAPALVPGGLDVLVIVCGSGGELQLGRDLDLVLAVLDDHVVEHTDPCPYWAISVPEAHRPRLLQVLQDLPDHNPTPSPATEPGMVVSMDMPADVSRSLAELEGQDAPIFPVLKPFDWNAREHAAFDNFHGLDKPPMPLVAYCRNTEDNFIFITKGDLDSRPLEQVRAEAMANIEAFGASWDPVNEDMLASTGGDFAAEKILCRDFLLEGHRLLNAQRILVGVPRRTCIMAVDADAPEPVLDQFRGMFSYVLDDDSFGNAPITNLLFRFEGAELIGAELIE